MEILQPVTLKAPYEGGKIPPPTVFWGKGRDKQVRVALLLRQLFLYRGTDSEFYDSPSGSPITGLKFQAQLTDWLMLFSATNYLQVPRHASSHTFVNFTICFLHHYLGINRREQPAAPKAGWVPYCDLSINKKKKCLHYQKAKLSNEDSDGMESRAAYLQGSLSSEMHTLFCLG